MNLPTAPKKGQRILQWLEAHPEFDGKPSSAAAAMSQEFGEEIKASAVSGVLYHNKRKQGLPVGDRGARKGKGKKGSSRRSSLPAAQYTSSNGMAAESVSVAHINEASDFVAKCGSLAAALAAIQVVTTVSASFTQQSN